MKVYTIKDIAAMAGVSVTTVSRVLNNRPDVNSATRKKVETIIRDCHFVGNTNARGLKQGNEVIGVVFRGRSNPFLSSLAEAILARGDMVRDSFITEYIDEQGDEFSTALRMTRQNHVKGLIFVGSLIDSTRQKLLTDERRADSTLGGQSQHLDTQLTAIADIVVEARLAVAAETVVVARQQQTDAQTVAQLTRHELTGRHGFQLGGEGEHLNVVDTRLTNEPQLLVERRQHLFAARRGVEGDDQRQQTTVTGLGHQTAEHELMAAVNTIEGAYGSSISYLVHSLLVRR